MNKLTAGIFAGILTIVSVNAADAAITSKAYVDGKFATQDSLATTNINVTNLTKTVGDNKTAAENAISGLTTVVGATVNDGLQKKVADLESSVGATGVAEQIADALGDIPENSDVATELGKKQDKSTAAYSMGGANGAWTVMTQAQQDALNSGATGELVGKITTNETAITKLNGSGDGSVSKTVADAIADLSKEGGAIKALETTVGEMDTAYKEADTAINNKIGTGFDTTNTVAKAIESAKTAASTGLTEKLGDLGEGNETVADALAKKVNTNASVATQMITTDASGEIVKLAPVKSETAGVYVLTAEVAENGTAKYYWESITGRGAESNE